MTFIKPESTHRYNLRSIKEPWHKPLSVAMQTYSKNDNTINKLYDLQLIYSIISNHISDIIHDGDADYVNSMILQHQHILVHVIKPTLRSRAQLDGLDELLGLMVIIHMKLMGL